MSWFDIATIVVIVAAPSGLGLYFFLNRNRLTPQDIDLLVHGEKK